MRINITEKEIQAIGNAWEEVNEKLECCMGSTKELKEILRRLRAIETKYKNA
jgi:hypothetical protein